MPPGRPRTRVPAAFLLAAGLAAASLAAGCFSTPAIELDPTIMPAWLGLAISQEELGRYREAITGYSRVLELSPDSFYVYRLLEVEGDRQNGRETPAMICDGVRPRIAFRELIMRDWSVNPVSRAAETAGLPDRSSFAAWRVGGFSLRRLLGRFLTVERAARVHHRQPEEFLGILRRAVAGKESRK